MVEIENDVLAISLAERQDLPHILEQIWRTYFPDTLRINKVTIDYCYPWKSRLGLIRLSLDQRATFIGINTLLQHPQIPGDVLLVTIAHQLTHYAQGFGSPLPRNCLSPSTNQLSERELELHNLGTQMHNCHLWIDKYWHSFYDKQRETGWSGFSTHGESLFCL